MKPLQHIGMGLVIIGLSANLLGHDLLADPVGWILILLGVRHLPGAVQYRTGLLTLAALAALASCAVWFPGVRSWLYDTDASLGWAVNLPQIGFTGLLCHALALLAASTGDTRATAWLRTTRVAVVVIGLLPVLVFGAGVAQLEVASYLGASLVLLVIVVELFSYASRPWAIPAIDPKTVTAS